MADCLLDLTVPGAPMGKGRPRFTRGHGNIVRTYTPKATASRENLIGVLALDKWKRTPIAGPVSIIVVMEVPVPKSWPKKKRADVNIGTHPLGKPDVDNCLKLVCDALNGIVWRDDSQVVEASVRKLYSGTPRTIIRIFAA